MHSPEETIYIINVPVTLNPDSINKLKEDLPSFGSPSSEAMIILQGSEEDIFCTGLDLQWVADSDPVTFQKDAGGFSHLLEKIIDMPCITVAVVNGNTVGGGLGIITACDIVLASSKSHFKLSEGLLGLIPALILPSLQQRLTTSLIKKMFFSSQDFTAVEALSMNLVDAVAQEADFENSVTQWLKQLGRCSLQSVKDLKALLREPIDYSERFINRATTILGNALNEQVRKRLRSIAYYMQ